MTRRRFVSLTAASIPVLSSSAAFAALSPDDLKKSLEEIRTKHGVPALTAGIITGKGLTLSAATGFRKAGGTTPVGNTDLWHYGSMTKAMTAMLLGTFVAEGKLQWDAKVCDLLPDLVSKKATQARKITVRHLLTHRSGLEANLDSWNQLPAPGNRPELVRREMARELLSEPGSTFLYSNVGYVVAGVVAERLGRGLWEKVITARLFKPLGMTMGFGGTGTKGKEDQPWPHFENGKPRGSNGPDADNPASLGPAGTCHGSLAEYAKFIADHLRGSSGQKALLPAGIYTDLHTAPKDADYALGWHITQREWAGGLTLTHNGSNTMNYAVVWVAPARDFAVMAACNMAGDKASAACDEAAASLIGPASQ